MAMPAMMKPLTQCRHAAELNQQQHKERLAKELKHEDAQRRVSQSLPPADRIAVRPPLIVAKCNSLSREHLYQIH
jgi:hypothetical protein